MPESTRPAPGSYAHSSGTYRMRPSLRPRHDRPAAAAVELAVLLPFLLFLSAISTDWARLLYHTISIETCARSGALALSDQVTWYQVPGNSSRATPYPTGFAAAGTPALTAPQQAVLETATRVEDPSLPAAATVVATQSTDATGSPVVTVTVTRTFTSITGFPGVPSAETLTRAVTMRVAPQATK
jgi:Flp pilus assembly protein TadG